MRDQRAERGVTDREHDQIARERQVDAEQRQRRERREAPQHERERQQRHDAVEKAGAELMGEPDEHQDVVGDAQMDIVDALVDETDAVVAPLRHPEIDIAVGHPFAPADDQRLAEPVLAHAGEDRAERDQQEHQELELHRVPVARFDAVEEGGVPLRHLDGDIDHEQLGGDHADEQAARPPAILRAEIGQRQPQECAQREDDVAHGSDTRRVNRPNSGHECLP